MHKNYLLRTLFIFIFALIFSYGAFILSSMVEDYQLHLTFKDLTNDYYTQAALQKESELAEIEIVIEDNPLATDGTVLQAVFDGAALALQAVDPTGGRGVTYLRVKPGKHTLSWKVRVSDNSWPNEIENKKVFTIKKDQRWMHILIRGNEVFTR
jgi:hypothetical protein